MIRVTRDAEGYNISGLTPEALVLIEEGIASTRGFGKMRTRAALIAAIDPHLDEALREYTRAIQEDEIERRERTAPARNDKDGGLFY